MLSAVTLRHRETFIPPNNPHLFNLVEVPFPHDDSHRPAPDIFRAPTSPKHREDVRAIIIAAKQTQGGQLWR